MVLDEIRYSELHLVPVTCLRSVRSGLSAEYKCMLNSSSGAMFTAVQCVESLGAHPLFYMQHSDLTLHASAKKWNDTIREAREDIASGRRRAQAVRGGNSAPPRLSAQGFRSVATLLRQRVRADEVSLKSGGGLLGKATLDT